MEYREYQLAAEKHLKTCKAILSMLATEKFDKILSNKERKYLLMDTYYLAGYIFESSINYALFKITFGRTSPRTANNFNVKSFSINESDCSFSFYSSTGSGRDRVRYTYYVAGHNFWHNLDLLASLVPLPTIRYFKRDLTPNVRNLIGNSTSGWKAEKRYIIERPPLSFIQVNELVSHAEILYKETLKIH